LNTQQAKNVFNRSGLAALSDLECSEQRDIFSILEKEQHAFLDRESEFRSKEYKWPRGPLYNWSRVWEYPYVYYHLAANFTALLQNSRPIVADVGSGVTFFPFSLAKIGYRVVCGDIDRICERDLALASARVPHSPGTVEFRLIDDSNLLFLDSECDAVYCISVLEHIPDFEKKVTEIARILKPGGLCLLTCDINLRPDDGLQLDRDGFARLTSVIDKFFIRIQPERTIHPIDVLTTKNSLYPLNIHGVAGRGWRMIKKKILKPLLGRKPNNVCYYNAHLAVLGLVLLKRA